MRLAQHTLALTTEILDADMGGKHIAALSQAPRMDVMHVGIANTVRARRVYKFGSKLKQQ